MVKLQLMNSDFIVVKLLIGMVLTLDIQLFLTTKVENNVLVLKQDLLIVQTKFMEIIIVDIKKMLVYTVK